MSTFWRVCYQWAEETSADPWLRVHPTRPDSSRLIDSSLEKTHNSAAVSPGVDCWLHSQPEAKAVSLPVSIVQELKYWSDRAVKSVKIWYFNTFSPYLQLRSLGLMALDVSARRPLSASMEPSRTSSSSTPGSPATSLVDSSENALYLKAVSEGREGAHRSAQHTSHMPHSTHVCSSSPSSSLLDSPQQSPLQDSASHKSVSPQPHSLPTAFMAPNISGVGSFPLQSAVRSLKFSIENILSPEFGKNEKECRKSIVTNGEKLKSHHNHRQNSRTHPLDVSSLTNKRKHSSDSESSNISSLSTTSRETTAKDTNGLKESADDSTKKKSPGEMVWPAWVYCTRYSDRPSSGESPLFLLSQLVTCDTTIAIVTTFRSDC